MKHVIQLSVTSDTKQEILICNFISDPVRIIILFQFGQLRVAYIILPTPQ